MKFLSWCFGANLFVSFHAAEAYRARFLRARAVSNSVKGLSSGSASDSAGLDWKVGQSSLEAALGSMVGEMMEGKGVPLRELVTRVHGRMDLGDAVRQLDGKLPTEVASLVRLTATQGAKSRGAFDENSLQKARRILNDMMFNAWGELDDVVIECKEFQNRNRGTYEQVVGDLARLGAQLAQLGQLRVKSASGITQQDRKRKDTEENLEKVTQDFTAKRFEDSRELTIRRNDLAVFDFVLNLTRCTGSGSFVQLHAHAGSTADKQIRICSTDNGFELNFDNPQLQAKVERMMTPEARIALREALGQAQGPLNLVQLRQVPVSSNATTTALPTFAAAVVPVSEKPHPGGQWKKCVDGTPNCGLLHDLMSLEWGKFRDAFDELTATMVRNQQDFDTTTRNINDMLTVINDEKTKYMETLAATISSINADTEEMNEKDEQKRELTKEFDTNCAAFRAKITEILFTKICAVRKVRNEVLLYSALTPPSKFSDCDFSDWASKTGRCLAPGGTAILCDDTCPQPDPYKCGGVEVLKRDIVVSPDQYGMRCPALERSMKCLQKRCPVACEMSEWSGWSKCTKDCEGGVQAKTRSILVKPKNGGMGCDAVQEARPCNTGSCDRDCSLADWTAWAPCSMACGGGMTSRQKRVLVPIRGQGRCPKLTSRNRLEEKDCNTQACVGDEMCIAQQDLILALDGSGSLKEGGFQILRNFAANLTSRYKSKYFGLEAVRIGVNLFGNGYLITLPDGTTTISPAINVQGLTGDLEDIRGKISQLKWQRGFTNMAQAFTLADTMLGQAGRSAAQSAVLVLSDGKYSFKYQTAEKARELKDKNVQIYMAPVTEMQFKELETLKDWASQPWETNYELIPGLEALKENAALFAQKLIVKFCPDSMSPSNLLAKENARQYMLIHEDGWPSDECGVWYFVGKVASKDDCAAETRERKQLAFAYGKSYAGGRCYTEAIAVDEAFWNLAKSKRDDPPCPSGEWLLNPFYDTYIINPRTV